MSALIVHLTAEPALATTEFGYALTRDGSTVDQHGFAQLSLLPGVPRAGTEVVALVPTEMMSWHRVELPKGTTAASPRLRAVLEGLLEDQLLDEPESLHFAVQPSRGAGPVWVAACDRAWLHSCVQALELVGRPVTRIVPEFAPEGEAVLYALGEPQRPLLVLAGQEGVAALPLSPQALSLLPELPQETRCVAEPAVAAQAEQLLGRAPMLQQAAERWVSAAQSAWDLAQFDLSSSGHARALKKLGTAWADVLAAPRWRPARWGAIFLIALNLVGLNAWAWRERAVLRDKHEEMRATLTQTFPQVKVVVDAPVQMERELAALRQATGGSSGRDLEAMLAALGSATPAGRSVTSLDYAAGELRVKGVASGPEDAQAMKEALRGLGYAATWRTDALAISREGAP